MPVPPTCGIRVTAVEELEDALALVGLDTRPAVVDGDQDTAVERLDPDTDRECRRACT